MRESADENATKRPAVFLDRDGTLIEDVHYLADPAALRLLPGVAAALKILDACGFRCVVVTNQSAVGRGIIDEVRLEEIHEELHRQLREHGAKLDAIYWCPVVPTTNDRSVVEHEDRKPGPGMLRRAAKDLDLDLSRSWMVGDSLCDLLAGKNAGCFKSVLVNPRKQEADTLAKIDLDYEVADDLEAAAKMIADRTRPPA